jgi:hypothetical protein
METGLLEWMDPMVVCFCFYLLFFLNIYVLKLFY